ncbi:MAG: PleD family two-component system response regulator [Actinomycetota bacterium]|nr:response regulator [Actinomycetota bacterium]
MSSKVLVVDDDPDIVFVLRVTLEAAGFTVVDAEDGALGFEVAKREHPDVVVTDIMMPVMDGHELIRKLRADPDTSDLPIIVVSAKPGGVEGVEAVIRKPWRNEELLRRLTELTQAS